MAKVRKGLVWSSPAKQFTFAGYDYWAKSAPSAVMFGGRNGFANTHYIAKYSYSKRKSTTKREEQHPSHLCIFIAVFFWQHP